MSIKNFIKNLLYPGLDLHSRSRRAFCKFWKTGNRRVLDAGNGNGYFSWLAYLSGAEVVALNIEKDQVERTSDFLYNHKKVPRDKVKIICKNLYDLDNEFGYFDEIICYETIEHIKDDRKVIQSFYDLLKPNGILHICAPNALHPRHQKEVLDLNEKGGHVRHGYTESTFVELLTPVGFKIEKIVGLGTKKLVLSDQFLRKIRNKFGDVMALPFFPFASLSLYENQIDPKMPFTLYVKAGK